MGIYSAAAIRRLLLFYCIRNLLHYIVSGLPSLFKKHIPVYECENNQQYNKILLLNCCLIGADLFLHKTSEQEKNTGKNRTVSTKKKQKKADGLMNKSLL